MTWRWSAVGLAVLVLSVFAAGAATSTSETSRAESIDAQTAAAMSVRIEVATPVDSFLRRRVYTGTLVARRRSVLSFETSGKLLELLADEGDRIAKDQPLAKLDTRRLSARQAQAAADLMQGTSVLNELIAGPRVQTIAAAAAEVRSLAAQRDVAERRLVRRKQLVGSNAISREEYDEALFEYRAAAARTDVAQKALDELEAGTRVEQVEAQRAQVSAIEARLADLNHELDDAVLLAPYAGRIAQRRIDEGTVVAAGAPVFDLIEDDALEAWVGVPAKSARLLKVGAEIRVTIDDVELPATIQSIRPELDAETRTQNVVIHLQETRGLVAGQIARVGLQEPVPMEGFWVPTATLTPDRRGLWSVLVVNDEGLAASRIVEVIENDGDRSFVRGTLQAGERIIVGGAHRVVAGQAVTSETQSPAALSSKNPKDQ